MENRENFDDRTCIGCLNKELRLASVLPTRERAELFFDSQWSWGRISLTYVIYRVTVAALVIAWAVADFAVEAGTWYSFNYAIWLVFATNWSLLLLICSCVVMAIATTYHFVLVRCYRRDERELRMQTMGGGLSLLWLLYSIASNTSIVVSISYWAFVAIIDGSGFMTTPMSQLKHTLNSVYVFVDIFVNGIPVRLLHVVYPLTFGLVYAVFSAVYFINDGVGPNGRHYAYYVMDWRNPLGSAATCLLGMILCVLVQGCVYGFYRIRILFHGRLTACVDEELQAVLPKDGGVGGGGLGGGEEEDTSGLFPRNVSGPNYASVNDLELKTG